LIHRRGSTLEDPAEKEDWSRCADAEEGCSCCEGGEADQDAQLAAMSDVGGVIANVAADCCGRKMIRRRYEQI